MVGWTEGWMDDRWMVGCGETAAIERSLRHFYNNDWRMGGWGAGGWTDEWIGGWLDGRKDGWMNDRWMVGCGETTAMERSLHHIHGDG